MNKTEFLNMTDSQAIEYISSNYDMFDVEDVCMEFVEEMNEDSDDDDDDDSLYEESSFEVVTNTLKGDDLKEYLWDNIVEQCEELEDDED